MEKKQEVPGTSADEQPTEFVDTPENMPGDQQDPPDTTGLGRRQPDDNG